MGYSGYVQCLCTKGHYTTMAHDDCETKCSAADSTNPHGGGGCFQFFTWMNRVDDTNGDSVGLIPEEALKDFLIEAAKTETCSHCNHTKVVDDARYRIPSDEETRKLRTYLDSEMGEYLPLHEE